jgi:hypothetical protein
MRKFDSIFRAQSAVAPGGALEELHKSRKSSGIYREY